MRTALRRCRRTSSLLDFDEVDEDVLRPEPRRRREVARDQAIERFLLLRRAGVVGGDLDDGEVIAVFDAEIDGAAHNPTVRFVFGYEVKQIIRRYVEGFLKRRVDSAGDNLSIYLGAVTRN